VAFGRFAQRGIRRYFLGKSDAEGVAYALERMVQLGAVILGVLIGLNNIGIDLTALAAIGAMLSVGIGFGLQGIAQNFVSGVTLLNERPIQKGD
jgi:small-conductance mechanosensitive channel